MREREIAYSHFPIVCIEILIFYFFQVKHAKPSTYVLDLIPRVLYFGCYDVLMMLRWQI